MAKFWGSRFKGKSDQLADIFSYSIGYDYRLAKYDCLTGIAHATMLGRSKVVPAKDAARLVKGLKTLLKKIESGSFKFDPKAEDVHSNVQDALKKIIGPAADKLHTGRSRNDLIVTDMKLYCLAEGKSLLKQIHGLQKAIVALADKNKQVIMPAYTHLQTAQLVLFSHYLLGLAEMLERDKGRLQDALKRLNKLPLGSAALSGTSLSINRAQVAKLLGFDGVTANSMDTVSDRDFLAEIVSALSILHVHFSRIAEDFIVWTTSEFNFFDIDWSLCTGSSIMPHKKNPDILELIRGEAATTIGNLNKLLILMKGLPHTYNRDLQLDKPPVFESFEKTAIITELLAKFFATLTVKKDFVEEKISSESFYSVDMMEYLIKKGVSYREAHDAIGRLVKGCLDTGGSVTRLSLKELKSYHPQFDEGVKKLLNPQMSVTIKKSSGSTNPKLVNQAIKAWKKRLSK